VPQPRPHTHKSPRASPCCCATSNSAMHRDRSSWLRRCTPGRTPYSPTPASAGEPPATGATTGLGYPTLPSTSCFMCLQRADSHTVRSLSRTLFRVSRAVCASPLFVRAFAPHIWHTRCHVLFARVVARHLLMVIRGRAHFLCAPTHVMRAVPTCGAWSHVLVE
jgi:hypothetical protein